MRTFLRTSRLANKSMLSSLCQQGKDEIFHLRRHLRQFRRPISLSNFRSYRTSIDTTTKTAATRTISTISVQEVNIGNYDDDDDSNNSTTTMSQQQRMQHKLAEIIRPYFKEQKPVVVRGAVLNTPATTLWSSWGYWQKKGEEQEHNVSVEMGGSYGNSTDPESERVEISFLAYLQFLQLFEERHGRTGSIDDFYHHYQSDEGGSSNNSNSSSSTIPTNNELVYMAQNDLFPSLYEDVMIPDFCCADDDDNGKESISNKDSYKNNNNSNSNSNSNNTLVKAVGYGRLYSVMMWLGPRGCVSPLHFDPLDNCFMQHQGRKRVLLFPPSLSPSSNEPSFWHYAGHEGQQSNTSPINPEILDWQQSTTEQQRQDETSSSDSTICDTATFKSYSKKYPLFFNDAPTRKECLLHPGDLLYIPKRWWHHVRSIDTSASVNVWWR